MAMCKEYAKNKIQEAIKDGGGFMNNVVGATLRSYASETSTLEADVLVVEMNLESIAGIPAQNRKAAEDFIKEHGEK